MMHEMLTSRGLVALADLVKACADQAVSLTVHTTIVQALLQLLKAACIMLSYVYLWSKQSRLADSSILA